MVPIVTPQFLGQKDLGNLCLVLGFWKRNNWAEDLNGSDDALDHLNGNTA
jgi:hypothetical protein